MVIGLVAQLGITPHEGLYLRHHVLPVRFPFLFFRHQAVAVLREGEELPLQPGAVQVSVPVPF